MYFKPQRQVIEPNTCSYYVFKGSFIIANLSLFAVAGLLISECVRAAGIMRRDPQFIGVYETLHPDSFYMEGAVKDAQLSLCLMVPSLILFFIQAFLGLAILFTINLKFLYFYIAQMYLTFIMSSVTMFVGTMAKPFLIGGLCVELAIVILSKKIISIIVNYNGLE